MANLLSNAIKFTPEGGRVVVSMESVTDDGRDAVRVSVSDTGPGIPREMQARVFDKFQQADTLVRDKEQGSGLGLALVHEIIGLHDGKVGLESQPGEGSVFWFVLDVNS
jgi:signal transduction histidine kinase